MKRKFKEGLIPFTCSRTGTDRQKEAHEKTINVPADNMMNPQGLIIVDRGSNLKGLRLSKMTLKFSVTPNDCKISQDNCFYCKHEAQRFAVG